MQTLDLDLALQREFAVMETLKFQIRAETFNALKSHESWHAQPPR